MNEEIIKKIQERLELGAKKYGKPNMNTDGRCFVTEALEEALDMCVYLAARLIEIKRTNSDRIIQDLYNKTLMQEQLIKDLEEKKS
tara:strand:+ start:126 stop:383 length:258 start_codon:yes stop_codon:yes gene_type:complete